MPHARYYSGTGNEATRLVHLGLCPGTGQEILCGQEIEHWLISQRRSLTLDLEWGLSRIPLPPQRRNTHANIVVR
jgi:hypothetical protein